jgi:hypothetical protein
MKLIDEVGVGIIIFWSAFVTLVAIFRIEFVVCFTIVILLFLLFFFIRFLVVKIRNITAVLITFIYL